MYRIGEFSYLYKLTIKTLRYYDEIDLFKPSYKEPYTGYRYYSEDQKEELEHILKLKDYGFTLEEIKDLKTHMSMWGRAEGRDGAMAIQAVSKIN